MLSIAVTAVIILTGSAQAGYFYPRPNIVFELPKNEPNFQEGFTQKARQENAAQQTHETVVSYSVPYQDFYYLHQNKIAQQTRPNLVTSTRTEQTVSVPSVSLSAGTPLLNSVPVGHTAGNIFHNEVPLTVQSLNLPVPIKHQNNLALNSLQYSSGPTASIANVKLSTLIKQQSNLPVNTVPNIIDIPVANVPSVSFPTSINQQNNLAVNTIPHINIPSANNPTVQLNHQSNSELNLVHQINVPSVNVASVNVPTLIDQESNLGFATQQDIHVTNHVINSDLDGSITAQNVVSPKITKDIYFHVPPPEFEEPPLRAVIPKKKIYKIIFIKVPSQDTKNIAQFQQLASAITPIEDKTIIYVLSKKPEPPQVVLPKPVPSEHEVLFVKYSGDPVGISTLANGNLEQPGSELLETSNLEPGAINGNGKYERV